jgi:thioredoxin-related protein
MKTILQVLAVICCMVTGAQAQPAGIPWMTSFTDAVGQAQASGKPILLCLRADYCEYCHQMDREAFVDSRCVLLSQEYIPCSMDGDTKGKDLLKKYKVQMYPFDAVLDATGAMMAPAPDYQTSDKFTAFLAQSLPAADVQRLAQSQPADAPTLGKLVVIDATKGDLADAEAAMDTLQGLTGAETDVTEAANHALGLAEWKAGQTDKAMPYLEAAIASLGDVHEAVDLHFALADCDIHAQNRVDAALQLQAVQNMHTASKDEKKRAAQQLKALSP